MAHTTFPPAGRARRSYRNLLIKPSNQLRLAILFAVLSFFSLCITIFVTTMYFSFILQQVDSRNTLMKLDPTIVTKLVIPAVITVFLIAFLTSAFMVALTIAYSHRLYGPLIPLLRHINSLKNGNYSTRVVLRKNDELREVMLALNDLATTLEERHPSEKKVINH